MALNKAIMLLLEMRESSMMPTVFKVYINDIIETVSQCEEPSTQPEKRTEERTETHGVCLDAISRRKAFEYFVTLWECIGTIMDRDEWEDVCMTTANEIPPAQPETNCSEFPNNWIPCSERQPDVNGWYVTTISGEICGQDRAFSGMSEFANGKWMSGDDVDETEMTIAWMPLPEAYQEGEKE